MNHYSGCTLLSDREIRELAEKGVIKNFIEKSKPGEISSGLSSYGYDARLGREFKIFSNILDSVIDPKDFKNQNYNSQNFVSFEEDFCIIPPNSFALGHTIEYFKIPDNVLLLCVGKSTYARCGIIVNVTPGEPGFEGTFTLELTNSTPLPVKVYANEGICQFLFFRNTNLCEKTYGQRNNGKGGKYMYQEGITLPRIE